MPEEIVIRDGLVELTEDERIIVPVTPNTPLTLVMSFPDEGLSEEVKGRGCVVFNLHQSSSPDGEPWEYLVSSLRLEEGEYPTLPDVPFIWLSEVPFVWAVGITPTQEYLVLSLERYPEGGGYPRITALAGRVLPYDEVMPDSVYSHLMRNKAALQGKIDAYEGESDDLENRKETADAAKERLEEELATYENFLSDEIEQYEELHPSGGS